MAMTDEGELSPSVSEAREGQIKIDHAKALKNRVYGLVRQTRPHETVFRQAIRNMLKAWDEVRTDQTGSVMLDVRATLETQVMKAKEKVLEHLTQINPCLSSLDQVVGLEGNPPKRGQVPLANSSLESAGMQESGEAGGFETVSGTAQESRPRPHPVEAREPGPSAVGPSRETEGLKGSEEVPNEMLNVALKGKGGKRAVPKNSKNRKGKETGNSRPIDKDEVDVQSLKEELRRAEVQTKELQEQLKKRSS